jgi:20S proteasome alpha/beta subunit
MITSIRASAGNELRLNAYTRDGDLAQVTFAARGVGKSSPAVGFVLKGNVGVLLFGRPCSSPLSVPVSRTTEWMDKVGICAVGYRADCARLKTEWRGVVENHKFIFGEAPSVNKIASKLSTVLTSGMYPDRNEKEAPFARPLAASVLFLASEGGSMRLLQLDNSGTIYECKGLAALGSVSSHADDLAAIVQVLSTDQTTAAAIESVASRLFQHIKRDLDEDVQLECECLLVDASGQGHVLLGRSPEELRGAVLVKLEEETK